MYINRSTSSFKEVAKNIARDIEGCDLAGFNSNRFDIPVLAEEFLRAGVDIDMSKRKFVDVQVIFHKMEQRTLSAAYKFYCEKNLEDAHTAEADTRATYEVLKAQLDRYPDLQNDIAFLADYSSFLSFFLLALFRNQITHFTQADLSQGRLRIQREITIQNPTVISGVFLQHLGYRHSFILSEVEHFRSIIIVNHTSCKIYVFAETGIIGKECDVIFPQRDGTWNSHVDLGLWADAMLIAPATASTIGKMANGIADNMLGQTPFFRKNSYR